MIRAPSLRRTTLAAVAAGVFAAVAAAGVPLVDATGVPYRWDLDSEQPNVVGGRVTYFLDPRGTTDNVGGPMSALDAVRAGIASWNVGTTRIRSQEDATRPASGRFDADRVNWIGWLDGTLGPFTYAATFVSHDGPKTLDADIVLNEGFTWGTQTNGTSGVADVQSLIAHEWGHAIGADHVPLRLSTMYFAADPGTIHLRSLSPDDIALVGANYPNSVFTQTTGTLRGVVLLEDPGDDRAVHVVAVSVSTAEPAASTLTGPDGSWEIRGLQAGTYRVLCAPTIPLRGAMNSFWTSGRTNFLPAVAAATQGNPAQVSTLRLAAQHSVAVPPMRVSATFTAPEPNDDRAHATRLVLGDAVCGRFDNANDFDWYEVRLEQFSRVTISVLAFEIGSDADPTLVLADQSGAIVLGLPTATDIRGGPVLPNPQDGIDRDARIVSYNPPVSGDYGIRVSQSTSVSGPNAFYVLFVTPATEAPSSMLTSVAFTPQRIDAHYDAGAPVATATLSVLARQEDGTQIGAGAVVQVLHDGAGTVGPVLFDAGSGTYRATVTAPDTPGDDHFSVTVTTAAGTASLPDAATLVYLGPVSVAKATLTVTPRRIAADGADTAQIAFTPRDARGEVLGPGRAVAFDVAPPLGTSIGPVADGDTYTATVTAGTTPGDAAVTAQLSGQEVGLAAPLSFGFGFVDVMTAARGDIVLFQTADGVPKRALKKLASANTKLAAAVASHGRADGAGVRKALGRAKAALAALEEALLGAEGTFTDPGTLREIALAVRQEAAAAADAAVIRKGRDQKRVDAARALLAEGDALRAAGGKASKAAARWVAAYAKVELLLP